MADVVGVMFQDGNKTYHFDSAGLELARGDRVVVQTSKGSEIGQVVEPTRHVDDADLPASLKKVVRVATGQDLEAEASCRCLRKEAMAKCRELIAAHGLDMKLVSADISFGRERVTFNFYSDERVDFRALVAELSKELDMRVELRQIGAREEARMVGGLGPCGRHLCCQLFPGDDDPVSIRMAKEQNLPLNPVKISGLCGRLMCCLKYEQEQYVTFRKQAPSRGTKIRTPAGESAVTGYNVLKESVTVRMEDGSSEELRLDDCEEQTDGSYVFTPRVVEAPVMQPALGGPLLGHLTSSGSDHSPDDLQRASSSAEAKAGDTAQVGKDSGDRGEGDTEDSAGKSRRPRSRRSRRRRSRSTTDGAAGESSADTRGTDSGGTGNANVERSSGGERKPRRRRRPRRSGGSQGPTDTGGGSSSKSGNGGSGD